MGYSSVGVGATRIEEWREVWNDGWAWVKDVQGLKVSIAKFSSGPWSSLGYLRINIHQLHKSAGVARAKCNSGNLFVRGHIRSDVGGLERL